MVTRTSSAITRWWRCGPRRVRSSMPGCARDSSAGHKRFVLRTRRPSASGRGRRPARRACRRRFLVLGAHRHLGPGQGRLVHHGHDQRPDQDRLHRGHRRNRLGPHCLSRRRRGPGGRGQLPHPRRRRGAHRAPGRAPHPPRRARPTSAVARLATPHVRHRPRSGSRRDGPIPPRARHGRTGHSRPEGRSGPRALSLGALLRQRGMARLRGARPQPRSAGAPVWATSIRDDQLDRRRAR